MQTFLPFLLVWDESKTVMENLQACFRLTAQLLDNKRTGKQRVEAMQLLNILLGRNPDSSWKRYHFTFSSMISDSFHFEIVE
jgi:hypothetical protein